MCTDRIRAQWKPAASVHAMHESRWCRLTFPAKCFHSSVATEWTKSEMDVGPWTKWKMDVGPRSAVWGELCYSQSWVLEML